jgi:hypothetical protein
MSHYTDDENFKNYKKIWDKLIQIINLKKLNIEVKFLYSTGKESDTNDYTIKNNDLISNCVEDYWHSLLIKVLNGFDYFLKTEHTFVFKTNLSTVLNIDRFYTECLKISNNNEEYVYRGVIGSQNDFLFCSGAGFLLNRKSVTKIVENSNLATKEWTDDIFVGFILNKLNRIPVSQENLDRLDILQSNYVPNTDSIKNATHIRIKIRNGDMDSKYCDIVYNILYN